ncbi:unnamed protein product [Paramecium octaurelia]|uniref:Uncharacterized protein n=1 Tax=Paramecium octaurelia TaxID=43137 RepID=A0A8S1TST7_PAROT|nr:unnamed protein product [Paramecium octaurelia]
MMNRTNAQSVQEFCQLNQRIFGKSSLLSQNLINSSQEICNSVQIVIKLEVHQGLVPQALKVAQHQVFLQGFLEWQLEEKLEILFEEQLITYLSELLTISVKNGYKLNPSKRPLIKWQRIKDNARGLILIGQTNTHIACLITNISRDKTQIQPQEDVGNQI